MGISPGLEKMIVVNGSYKFGGSATPMIYERHLLKRTLKKICAICMKRENRSFTILLGPCLMMLLLSNHLSIEASKRFAGWLAGECPLADYATTYLASKILLICTEIAYELTISRVYATSMACAVEDFVHMEEAVFRAHSIGGLSTAQLTKGEALSIFVYLVVYDIVLNAAYLLQGLYTFFRVDRYVFIPLLATVSAHIFVYWLTIGYLNEAEARYERAKLNVSSVMTNECNNSDVVRVYDLEQISMHRVNTAIWSKFLDEKKYNVYRLSAKTILEIMAMVMIIVFTYLDSLNVSIARLVFTVDVCCKSHACLSVLLEKTVKASTTFYIYYMFENSPLYCARQASAEEEAGDQADAEEIIVRERHAWAPTLELRGVRLADGFLPVDLQIAKGEKVAIVGKSSAGKTLLLRTIAGLNPAEGSILACGLPASSCLMSFAAQAPLYTVGTIMENLQYGNGLQPEDVISKCKALNVHDVIMSIKGGYDSWSMTGGSNLSGGQKQRIHVVRELLKNRPIALYDDCFANLEKKTALYFIGTILRRSETTTLLVLSDLSLLPQFDSVILIKNEEDEAIVTYGPCEQMIDYVLDYLKAG